MRPLQRKREIRKVNKTLRSLRSLRENKNTLIFISRKGRRGRRTSNANYAAAGVVTGYARQRAQRRNGNGNGNHHPTLRFNERKTENYPPPPRFALVHPVSGGQSVTSTNAITHFLPLRQAGVPHRGEGVDKNSLRTLVVTKFATTPAPA